MKKETREIKFSISLEGKPEQDLHYEAAFFGSNGALIDSKPVKNGQFSLTLPIASAKTARLLIYAILPSASQTTPQLTNVLRQNAYEPVLPALLPDKINLEPIPEPIWRWWLVCKCVVTGTIWNSACNPSALIPNARVHVCTVEALIYWLRVLSDDEILSIRDDIRYVLHPVAVVSGSDAVSGSPVSGNAGKFKELPDPEAARLMKANMPAQNLVQFYSSNVDQIRAYLLDNLIYFRPIFCFFPWWWWLISDEVGVVQTNNAGVFSLDFWYFCFEKPGIYIWVEYSLGGVWQTVYRPFIGCGTWWDYACGTNIDIYVNNSSIPCLANPTIPGSSIVITTIGNNVNVNQIPQTVPPAPAINNLGLMPGDAPFGGQLEPRVLFGDALAGSYYYRWSYRLHSSVNWTILNASVGRHYWEDSGPPDYTVSFPVAPLGPVTVNGTPNLFAVQSELSPIGTPWYIVDDRFDLPSAFFYTLQLSNGVVSAAAGLYDLKFEVFDNSGNLVDLTAAGIPLLVVDSSMNAPFGGQLLTTVTPDAGNLLLADGSTGIPAGHLVGYTLTIMVDNNPVSASISPVTSDGTGTCGTGQNCGFITFETASSPVNIQYIASHPHNFATFSFSIVRGTAGAIHSASGNLLDPSPSISFSPSPMAVPIAPGATENTANDQFTYALAAGDLLGDCTKAAFGCELNVWGTANDGYNNLGYDQSAAQAFALITQADCVE